jgi:hypothetical protein
MNKQILTEMEIFIVTMSSNKYHAFLLYFVHKMMHEMTQSKYSHGRKSSGSFLYPGACY